MESVLTKIRHYMKEYIGKVRWVKHMIFPVVIALILATYLDVQCSSLSSQMTDDHVGQNDESAGFDLLKLFILCFSAEYTLKYIVSIFNVQFIGVSMRSGFTNFFEEYLAIKYAEFHKIGVGEAQYNITRRTSALADFLTTLTMYFISNIFFFVVAIYSGIAPIPLHTKLLIVCSILLFLAVSTVIQYYRAKVRKNVNLGFQINSRKLYDILFNYERIVAYDNLDVESQKYWSIMNNQVFYSIIYWSTYELVDLMNNLAFIFFQVYLITRFNQDKSISKDKYKIFVVLFTKLREKVFEISRNIDEMFTLFTNVDQSAIEGCPADNPTEGIILTDFRESLTISNLTFYQDDSLIFSDVNTTIRKGEMIAITGTNGAGKSTFVKVLLCLYDYQGTITIDSHNYSVLSKKSIRNLIGYIPQNSFLFDGSIMDNLTLAHKDISHEKLLAYTKLYQTHDLFAELGYDKQVGERGMNLSGGQAQKLSFMRGVIKNAPIFILDEATSNMDAPSENNVIRSLKEHAANKTVLMIVHNLSLLQQFDRIFFFDNKTLAEQGSFEELQAAKGGFEQFYRESQATETNQ